MKIKIIIAIILITLLFLLLPRYFSSGASTTTILNGKTLSAIDYSNLKTSVTNKFDTKTLNPNDGEDWKAVVANEVSKCKGWTFVNVKNDLMEQLNSKLKSGKC